VLSEVVSSLLWVPLDLHEFTVWTNVSRVKFRAARSSRRVCWCGLTNSVYPPPRRGERKARAVHGGG
jgi:hypothetical protein